MTRLSNEEQRIEAEEMRAVAAAISSLCSQSEFRLLVRRFLQDCGALDNFGTGSNTHTTNALTTAFENGRASVLQYFVTMLAAVQPDIYIQILKENLNASHRRSGRIAHLADPGRDDADAD